ncbi:MAG: alpha-glucosidase [Devosia sp.]
MISRRNLFIAGAAGAAAMTALSAQAQDATTSAESWPIGDFLLFRDGDRLWVAHSTLQDRILWETATGDFISAEIATADVKDFGTPEGSFEITDTVAATYTWAKIDTVTASGSGATVTGTLRDHEGNPATYSIAFTAKSPSQLGFTVSSNLPTINRIILRLASTADEGIFGFGMQMTYFDQKGHLLPIVVQEHGVGRGQPIVTQIVDVAGGNGGGTPYSTEAPVPQFITSRLRALFLENTEYSTFDMRDSDAIEIKLWAPVLTGRIVFGATPIDIIASYSEYSGRMRALPDWVHEGVIVSVQGGTDKVRAKLDDLNSIGVPLAGLWIQDWPGIRVTNVGSQLWWDWKLDETFYPGWTQLVADLEAQGARMLTYINPFLSHEDGHNTLYLEAEAKGYLVQNTDGTPFLNKNTNFTAALVDLSNGYAREWIKGVIKTNMIEATGTSGWMHDFGEAMPFVGKIAGGEPAAFHNQYPVEWARVAREAIEEAGRGDDILFFDRSGYAQSPGRATAFWLGDQLQSWDEYDGIKSAVVGLLSSGLSGYSIVHSDTGGYGALKFAVGGHTVPVVTRTPELFMRWMELNAFTAIFRTHEGLDPAISAQFDTNADTKAHLRRFAEIYKALAPYRKAVVAEAVAAGTPVVRHPFLHYPNDPNTYGLRFQFLLGADLMVAPVLDKGATRVEVYFPEGDDTWIDLWSGKPVGEPGRWLKMPAPMGQPVVLLRAGTPAATDIPAAFTAAGLI